MKNREIGLKSEKISIIIPVYNIKDLLNTTLTSVVGQTYKNIEVILIDDGSTDGSDEVCDFWESQDVRIRSFHKKNEGVSVARNYGFSKSTGDYILFIDGDDEIDSQMCEKLLDKLLEKEAEMSYCGYQNIYFDKSITNIPDGEVLEGSDIVRALVTDGVFFSAVWNKMFRREVLLDQDGNFVNFASDIHISEDFLWLSKVLKNVKRVASIPEILYYWKRRDDSATKGSEFIRLDEKFLSMLKAYRCTIEEIEDKCIKKIVSKTYLGLSRDCLVQAYKEKNNKLTESLINRIQKDKHLYDGFDLFIIKLKICVFMVKNKFPSFLIEQVQAL